MTISKPMFIILILLAGSTAAIAESVYITDETQAGLHLEKTVDSPITRVLPTATELELIKQEDTLSYVRTADGTSGWIDNSYLKTARPAGSDIETLRERIRSLEARLLEANRKLQGRNPASGDTATNADHDRLIKDYEKLQQQYNEERIRSGELQVQLAELRKHLGQNIDNESLYEKIARLEEENKSLKIRLASALEPENGSGLSKAMQYARENSGSINWKVLSVLAGLALVIGLLSGVYLMDYLNRRRHGGFRI